MDVPAEGMVAGLVADAAGQPQRVWESRGTFVLYPTPSYDLDHTRASPKRHQEGRFADGRGDARVVP